MTSPMSEYHKIELEYILRCSPNVLYSFLTEPSGLSEWFCDNVNIRAEVMTFIWNKDSEQRAKKTGSRENSYVRYRWLDSPENVYFEFRIQVDDITGETALMITDFAEDGDEEETRLSWDSAIQKLHRVIGS
jgi:uncharacterized protein YndB with AHSA1/START domain